MVGTPLFPSVKQEAGESGEPSVMCCWVQNVRMMQVQ